MPHENFIVISGCDFPERLIHRLRRLSAEYDGFLYGSLPKPPVQTRRHVEEMVRRLNATEDMSAAERYRFGALQGRFSALCDRWEKLQGEKEAGRRPGLYGHFREAGGGSPGQSAPPPNARPATSVQEERRAASPEPDRDVSGYRLEGFVEGLERERRKVRERLGEGEILFDVTERDGRVRLVAKKKPRGGA